MRLLTFFINFILLCTASCTHRYPISNEEKAVNKQMGYSTKMLSKKYNVQPFGVGVSMPEGDIRYLGLEFKIKGPLSKMAIRQVLIDMVHDFLCNINNDVELCSYLKKGKLDISEVSITLYLHDAKHQDIPEPDIGVAYIDKGLLKFITLEPDKTPSFKDRTKESYEEALHILQSQAEPRK